jgi:hypothetical protein
VDAPYTDLDTDLAEEVTKPTAVTHENNCNFDAADYVHCILTTPSADGTVYDFSDYMQAQEEQDIQLRADCSADQRGLYTNRRGRTPQRRS